MREWHRKRWIQGWMRFAVVWDLQSKWWIFWIASEWHKKSSFIQKRMARTWNVADTTWKYRRQKKILAKFPSVAAIVAEDESCHRFIGRPRLQLIVRTLALSASPTLKREQMEMGAWNFETEARRFGCTMSKDDCLNIDIVIRKWQIKEIFENKNFVPTRATRDCRLVNVSAMDSTYLE